MGDIAAGGNSSRYGAALCLKLTAGADRDAHFSAHILGATFAVAARFGVQLSAKAAGGHDARRRTRKHYGAARRQSLQLARGDARVV